MEPRRVRDIEYFVAPGSERSTTDIVIERDGKVVVRPPSGLSPEQIDAIVDSKRMWIYRNVAEWEDLNKTSVKREWINGETFLYLGSACRLFIVDSQNEDLILKDSCFYLSRSVLKKGGVLAAQKTFESFYVAKGLEWLDERVAYYAPKVGVAVTGIKVKDLGYRWASCGTKGVLNFHWKCMMAPPKIIDYVVVHELCHFHHRNHTDAFWDEVDKILPDYRDRKEWLRKRGASLDL